MKLNKLPKYLLATTLLYLGVSAIVSCTHCPNCAPVQNCALKPPPPDRDGGGPSPSALLSDRLCSTFPKCSGAVSADYTCMVYDGCDDTSGLCKLKLGSSTYQCGAGSMRNCLTRPEGARGVI